MRLPLRLAGAGESGLAPGLLVAIGVSTAVFSATPLVLPEIIDDFDVAVALVGLVSGAQLAGFVVTSFLAGRLSGSRRTMFVTAIVVLAASNLSSALVDSFGLFVTTRFVAGLALGALTWLGWSSVFGQPKKMGRVAIIGPVSGVVASPILGLIVDRASFQTVYLVLAGLALAPLALVPTFADDSAQESKRAPTGKGATVAYVLIGCLGLLTLGGSSVYVFSGVIALEEQGLSAFGFSLVLAANAAAGIPSSRWTGDRRYSGVWFTITGAAAGLFVLGGNAIVGTAALVTWGFAYWMGVPGAFQLLSERSRFPAERAGDAQAIMALGRIVGPIVGGALAATGSFVWLGLVGGGAMVLAGVVILVIEVRPASTWSAAAQPVT